MSRVADPLVKVTLLRAAEEVFAARGLSAAKVEEIARRAGVSKGAFYLHFESKEAALKQVVETFLARCGRLIAAPSAYPALPEDPARLLDFCLARDLSIFEFLWQNKAILRILGTCHGPYDYLVEAFRAEMADKTRAWTRHWQALGLFRPDLDPELVSAMINGAYGELSTRMLAVPQRPPLEGWVAFACETFARGFGTPELIAALDRRAPGPSAATAALENDRRVTASARTKRRKV